MVERDENGRIKKGVLNPVGRKRSSHNHNTLAASALLTEHSVAIMGKLVEMAENGDPAALKLCVERILPPARDRPVDLSEIGELRRGSDVTEAMKVVIGMMTRGELNLGELKSFVEVLDTVRDSLQNAKHDAFTESLDKGFE